MDVASFIEALGMLHFDHVFNPYTDHCALYDKPDASRIRKDNLRTMLTAVTIQPLDALWVARDLGYRGGRRTGIALTDDIHLPMFGRLYGGGELHRATIGPPVAEHTAAIIWRILRLIPAHVFLWNVFPLHPHLPGEPLSNRCHTAHERRACEPLLVDLVDMLTPRRIVAIGGDAHKVVKRLGYRHCYYVRHPSYGGHNEFMRGIKELYELDDNMNVPTLFDGIKTTEKSSHTVHSAPYGR